MRKLGMIFFLIMSFWSMAVIPVAGARGEQQLIPYVTLDTVGQLTVDSTRGNTGEQLIPVFHESRSVSSTVPLLRAVPFYSFADVAAAAATNVHDYSDIVAHVVGQIVHGIDDATGEWFNQCAREQAYDVAYRFHTCAHEYASRQVKNVADLTFQELCSCLCSALTWCERRKLAQCAEQAAERLRKVLCEYNVHLDAHMISPTQLETLFRAFSYHYQMQWRSLGVGAVSGVIAVGFYGVNHFNLVASSPYWLMLTSMVYLGAVFVILYSVGRSGYDMYTQARAGSRAVFDELGIPWPEEPSCCSMRGCSVCESIERNGTIR